MATSQEIAALLGEDDSETLSLESLLSSLQPKTIPAGEDEGDPSAPGTNSTYEEAISKGFSHAQATALQNEANSRALSQVLSGIPSAAFSIARGGNPLMAGLNLASSMATGKSIQGNLISLLKGVVGLEDEGEAYAIDAAGYYASPAEAKGTMSDMALMNALGMSEEDLGTSDLSALSQEFQDMLSSSGPGFNSELADALSNELSDLLANTPSTSEDEDGDGESSFSSEVI